MRVAVPRSAFILALVPVVLLGSGCRDDTARRGAQSVVQKVSAPEAGTPQPAEPERIAEPSSQALAIAAGLSEGLYAVLILHKGEPVDDIKSAITPLVDANKETACFVADARDAGMAGLFRELKLDPETAPTPLAMVLAPNKVVTGIFMSPPDAEQFNDAILPSQPLAVRKALVDGKAVILKMQTDKTTGNEETNKAIKHFLSGVSSSGKYVALPISLDTPENGSFLRQLGIDPDKETKSVILAMAPPLQIVSKPFRGAATKDIVAAMFSSSCGSSCGSGST